MLRRWRLYIFIFIAIWIRLGSCDLPPVFTQDMNNLALPETIPLNSIVYKLEGYDPEGEPISFGLVGSDNFAVDSQTGEVKLIKELDREKQDTLSFLVTIKDRVNVSGDTENDNLVKVPITVIVLDENDNAPIFQNVPYETEVLENAPIGTTVFNSILVIDKDTVGENLNISCIPQPQNPTSCSTFMIEVLETSQEQLKAAIILNDKLDYNEYTIYHMQLLATDDTHTTTTGLEIRVIDVQNSPPIFQGSQAAIINEDSPIGKLVMTINAKDGDRGQPRKIVYDLITNPMDYFLLDSKTGELRTAKPLDKEALPDATGLILLTIRAREIIDGVPGNDPLTMSTTQASVTILDVNDSPPTFNQQNYYVSLQENTPSGTPLPLDMSVHDPDVGSNAKFSLRLDDVSGVFDVEPKTVISSSQVNIRVANGSLDYENPNQRKFIVLVIAEETDTEQKLSSTATLTVSITDANDNRPMFEQESYSISVSESAHAGNLISTITAKDLDSGHYGDQGIRYSLSGTGSELFHVDPITGAITVAKCSSNMVRNESVQSLNRRKRQVFSLDDDIENTADRKNVNLTHVGQTGYIDIDSHTESIDDRPSIYHLPDGPNSIGPDYGMSDNDMYEITTLDVGDKESVTETVINQSDTEKFVPGMAPCLDYETQSAYFLSYKATDDDGKGQTSVVSLRISLIDANDSPPTCESPLYRASLDEGAIFFDPPLIIKARDPDTVSDINYRIIGDLTTKFFSIDKRSGQLSINDKTILDVNHLNTDSIFFSVEASDGLFTVLCDVNITIRDVNNHAPQFSRDNYMASIAENTPIGTSVEQVNAMDLDTGINADIRYRIQQGSFDDFTIDNGTGLVTVAKKLDYDRRNTYQIEILAADLGTPSLSGTSTLTVSIINSNDKDPYFTPATQRAEIREDVPIGTLVHTLMAIDPDIATIDALDYSATEPITAVNKDGKEINDTDDFKDMFSVDRTGRVTVNRKLNRDLIAVIRITVLVTDTTAPSIQQGKGLLVITIIDVNELPPIFMPPWSPTSPILTYQILEEQPIGTVLTTLQATDIDSNIDQYNLTENDYFEINNSTGLIRTKNRIDYESIKQIKFNAIVTDTGIPQLTSTAELIVDVININDNDPMFNKTEYRMQVVENSPRGTVVGKVWAIDNDNGQLGEIIYSLVGDQSKYFNIEPDTGIISVLNSTYLDREQIPEVVLTAVASDSAPKTTRKSTTVPVHIKILDVNDNKPMFTQKRYSASISENAALNPPAKILQVTAVDADNGTNGDVKYFITSNSNDMFRLDPDTGILYPRKSFKGLKGEYPLKIEARDGMGSGPFADQALIIIDIHSVNKYRPVFIMPALSNASVELQENLVLAGYLVMTVKATDNDTFENGKVKYHLQVENQNVQETNEFIIDEQSGELRTKGSLNRKIQSKYELVLVAQDQGDPVPFETLRFLTILLVDVNENKPEFPDASNPYKFFVQENGDRDQRIGKIQAFFMDKEPNYVNIYYYMLLGNENSAFYLDKMTGDIFTNKSLDREMVEMYHLFIMASKVSDLHISDEERASYSLKSLERDSQIAKVQVTVLDVNDNAPAFERKVYYAGVNARSSINQLVTVLNATDSDYGINATFDLIIVASNLYKFGSTRSTGSIVPSPFVLTKDGRLSTATYMAEYNQDRFELDIIAKETESPEREAMTKVYVWIFNPEQLVRVILSRPPAEVHTEQEEIIAELKNATQKLIIIDDIRYHVDAMGRIRMDWCDLFFHAVDPDTQMIVPVDDLLKVIDAHYEFLKDYYAGFAIENVVPAHSTFIEEEFDLALAGLVALLIVLFVGAISFLVLCCCLKHWTMSIPSETRRKDALIKKQFVDDLSTTENPLWIEQKLKLYEEQELTMQVFSEPELPSNMHSDNMLLSLPHPIHNQQSASPSLVDGTTLGRRDSYEQSQMGDNTYATIQPRQGGHHHHHHTGGSGTLMGGSEVADYATLRNNGSRPPSVYEFTGSTFQVPHRDRDDNFVAELI